MDAIDAGARPGGRAAVVVAAETGLRPEEWVALERRDVDRAGAALAVQRKFANGGSPLREDHRAPATCPADDAGARRRSRRCRRGWTRRSCSRPPRAATSALDNWRTREWYPALEAAGIAQRGPYYLRHTFATEALAAGISTFELSRLMGTSIAMIDRHYGHLTRDAEESMRARLDARSDRSGVYLASETEGSD